MAATYNYNLLQKEVHLSEIKAYRTLIGLIITVVLLGVFFIIAFLIWKYSQRKLYLLKAEFANTTDEYEENMRELRLLESTHQEVIATIQQELTDAQNENSSYREKYNKSQQVISQINQDYELERTRLLTENEILQNRINEFQKDKVISKHLSVSVSFAEEPIVRQMREIAKKPLTTVTEKEWNELTEAFGKSFPSLYHDLSLYCNTPQNIRVCILTALCIGSSEQANMLETTKQRISNVKSTLNKALFHETSSRTLYRNLVVRYNVYSIERYNLSENEL